MAVTLKKNHAAVKRQMHSDVARGENRAAQFLVQEAQSNAPVKTGHLKGSIEQITEATPDSPSTGAKVGAPYGRIVDQGDAHHTGTYFWTKALLALRANFGRFMKSR